MVNDELSHVQECLILNQPTLNVKKCNFNYIVFESHKKQVKTNLTSNLNSQKIQ